MSETPIDAQLAAVTISGSGPTLHRADVSSPSTNPRLQLMGMPREVRDEIYRNLLVKDGVVLLDIAKSYLLSFGHLELIVGPKNITSILRVNRETNEEGLHILYGENKFECDNPHSFQEVFMDGDRLLCNCAVGFNPFCTGHCQFPGNGRSNAAKIKHVTFRLEGLCGRTYTELFNQSQDHPDHGIFLELLCTILPGLQKLTLKLQAMDPRARTPEEESRRKSIQVQCITTLISTAGRITKYHPVLRKAIWRHRGSSDLVDFDQIVPSDHNWRVIGNFYIDVVAEGARPLLRTSKTAKNVFVDGWPSSDIVLDSQLIRRTGWVNSPLWSNVANFELRPDSTATGATLVSSGKDHTAVTTWPGVAKYDPFSEIGLEDQAALLEKHHGRWVGGKYLEGRIVNG